MQKDTTMSNKLTTHLEIKALSKRQFEGYGSIFGNKDLGDDVVMHGAFNKTLSDHKGKNTLPAMLWMHDPGRIPGKWLEMEEDANGLYVKGVLADTDLGNEVHTLLGMKAVSGLSIGYITKQQEFEDGIRLIKEADLLETSIVSIPMNPLAQVTHSKTRLSAAGEYVPTLEEIAYLKRDAENFLQRKGMPRKLAVTCVSNLFGKEAILEPEPDEEVILESIKTPEEIEIDAGMSSFREKIALQDLEKSFKRIFNNG